MEDKCSECSEAAFAQYSTDGRDGRDPEWKPATVLCVEHAVAKVRVAHALGLMLDIAASPRRAPDQVPLTPEEIERAAREFAKAHPEPKPEPKKKH